jgi:hypothetical protein
LTPSHGGRENECQQGEKSVFHVFEKFSLSYELFILASKKDIAKTKQHIFASQNDVG